MVSIGSIESGTTFSERTGFPAAFLLADPDNAAYDALDFKRGLKATFLSKETGEAIKARQESSGGTADLQAMMKQYKVFKPPKGFQQALIQGGCLVFEGRQPVLVHLDPSTAAHVEFDKVLALVGAK